MRKIENTHYSQRDSQGSSKKYSLQLQLQIKQEEKIVVLLL